MLFYISSARNTTVYRCKICCKELITQTQMRTHVKNSHLDDEGNVKFVTTEIPITASGKRRNTDSTDGNYECGKCRRKFLRMKDLNCHGKTCCISRLQASGSSFIKSFFVSLWHTVKNAHIAAALKNINHVHIWTFRRKVTAMCCTNVTTVHW